MTKPRAIDLFCGLGGWTDGLLAEGYDVTGYDIEEHAYGEHRYPAELVLQDVRTLHGAQFKDVALIVASPPCQEYSYMAMPWSLAKAKAAAIRADDTGEKLAALNRLFNECFRIQREASFAAGHLIPLVVENVRGAQPWVGRARWNFGSFYLWGDVPALMPETIRAQKFNPDGTTHPSGSWFAIADSKDRGARGRKVPGAPHTKHLTNPSEHDTGVKFSQTGAAWFDDGKPRDKMLGHNGPAAYSSQSSARKQASAMIAKIPLPLSQHIAASYRP